MYVGGGEFLGDVFEQRGALGVVALFLRQADIGFDVARFAVEGFFRVDAVFELLALLQDGLRFFLILPEIRVAYFFFDAASCLRAESASKIAPHKLDAFLELGVALLQVFDVFSHVGILTAKFKRCKGWGVVFANSARLYELEVQNGYARRFVSAKTNRARDASTQSQANQSPKRT
jgi:hypothetical protein